MPRPPSSGGGFGSGSSRGSSRRSSLQPQDLQTNRRFSEGSVTAPAKPIAGSRSGPQSRGTSSGLPINVSASSALLGAGGGPTSSASDQLARFRESQAEHDKQQNLKQQDALQMRLAWKEQMERSAALDASFNMNKKTLSQLEKQLEALKRELAGERAAFDADLLAKQARLNEAKALLAKRRERLDRANQELYDSRAAIARMRAVLVENFCLSKTYAKVGRGGGGGGNNSNGGEEPVDVTEEDHKFFKLTAPELDARHKAIVERYVRGGTRAGDAEDANRVLRADPETKRNKAKAASSLAAKLRQQQEEDEAAAAAAAAAAAQETDAVQVARRKEKAKGQKALSEVKLMLLELEREICEAEQEGTSGTAQQLQQQNAAATAMSPRSRRTRESPARA